MEKYGRILLFFLKSALKKLFFQGTTEKKTNSSVHEINNEYGTQKQIFSSLHFTNLVFQMELEALPLVLLHSRCINNYSVLSTYKEKCEIAKKRRKAEKKKKKTTLKNMKITQKCAS